MSLWSGRRRLAMCKESRHSPRKPFPKPRSRPHGPWGVESGAVPVTDVDVGPGNELTAAAHGLVNRSRMRPCVARCRFGLAGAVARGCDLLVSAIAARPSANVPSQRHPPSRPADPLDTPRPGAHPGARSILVSPEEVGRPFALSAVLGRQVPVPVSVALGPAAGTLVREGRHDGRLPPPAGGAAS